MMMKFKSKKKRATVQDPRLRKNKPHLFFIQYKLIKFIKKSLVVILKKQLNECTSDSFYCFFSSKFMNESSEF